LWISALLLSCEKENGKKEVESICHCCVLPCAYVGLYEGQCIYTEVYGEGSMGPGVMPTDTNVKLVPFSIEVILDGKYILTKGLTAKDIDESYDYGFGRVPWSYRLDTLKQEIRIGFDGGTGDDGWREFSFFQDEEKVFMNYQKTFRTSRHDDWRNSVLQCDSLKRLH